MCRLFSYHKKWTTPYHPPQGRVHREELPDAGPLPEGCMPGNEAGMGRASAAHINELSATPQASTGVTPNMMMLGCQTRLPNQAIYGSGGKDGEGVRDGPAG